MIRVLKKIPEQPVEAKVIPNTYDAIYDEIGGDIHILPSHICGQDVLIVTNGDSVWDSYCEPNFIINDNYIFGTALVVKISDDKKSFASCNISAENFDANINEDFPTYFCKECEEYFSTPDITEFDQESENGVASLFPDHHIISVAVCPECGSSNFKEVRR